MARRVSRGRWVPRRTELELVSRPTAAFLLGGKPVEPDPVGDQIPLF